MKNLYKAIIIMSVGFAMMILAPLIQSEFSRLLITMLGFLMFIVGFMGIGSFGELFFGKE